MADDITFIYLNQQGQGTVTTTLNAADKIISREALGVWKVDNHAWKVYATTNQYQALRDDYRLGRAKVAAGLPMGDPRQFQQGTVKQGTNAPSDGFILMTEKWIDGINFQKRIARLNTTALKKEGISHATTSTDYQRYGCAFTVTKDDYNTENYCRIKRGCDAANVV